MRKPMRIKELAVCALAALVVFAGTGCKQKPKTDPEACEVPTPHIGAHFTQEWIDSHVEGLESIDPENCESRYCYACHVSAAPHKPGMVARHINEYKADPKSCLACHDHYDSCNECHQAKWAHDKNTNKWDEHGKFFNVDKPGQRTNASCAACHTVDYCNNGECHKTMVDDHAKGWSYTHPMVAKKENQKCRDCHTHSFCITCHQKKIYRYHDSTWGVSHQTSIQRLSKDKSKALKESCGNCHATEFCQKCHVRDSKKFKYHDRADWRTNHTKQAKKEEASCIACHGNMKFSPLCQSCHGYALPHPEEVLKNHGPILRKNPSECTKCHKSDFCDKCHAKSPPASHSAKDYVKNHKADAAGNVEFCNACHNIEGKKCKACHSLIPHPKDYLKTHGKEAAEKSTQCSFCHDQKFCDDCHKKSKPADHKKANFKMKHGPEARANNARCVGCHAKSYCDTCHGGGAYPHADDIASNHGDLANKQFKRCAICHKTADCENCHSDIKPADHNEDFMSSHGPAAKAKNALCMLCHKKDYCAQCH